MAICLNDNLVALKAVLNSVAVIPSIVVSDTETTNTGRLNGVVTKLQKEYSNLRYEPCRLHVLDLIIKHEFSLRFVEKTISSNLPYQFVKEVQENCGKMRDDYVASCIDDEANPELPQTESRRRDYQLLLKFVKAVRFLRKEGCHPFIRNIPLQPPSISNARWNSRAIYSLFF